MASICSVFKWSGCTVFKNKTFGIQSLFDHSITEPVRYSDPHCKLRGPKTIPGVWTAAAGFPLDWAFSLFLFSPSFFWGVFSPCWSFPFFLPSGWAGLSAVNFSPFFADLGVCSGFFLPSAEAAGVAGADLSACFLSFLADLGSSALAAGLALAAI